MLCWLQLNRRHHNCHLCLTWRHFCSLLLLLPPTPLFQPWHDTPAQARVAKITLWKVYYPWFFDYVIDSFRSKSLYNPPHVVWKWKGHWNTLFDPNVCTLVGRFLACAWNALVSGRPRELPHDDRMNGRSEKEIFAIFHKSIRDRNCNYRKIRKRDTTIMSAR